jgi:hypothetical protein
MFAFTSTPPSVAPTLPAARAIPGSYQEGAVAFDQLLADVNSHDARLVDAILDLRSVCLAGIDAEACMTQLFHVRHLLGGRHYLSFYRIRRWARRSLSIEVRADRWASWLSCSFPLNCARLDEAVNTAIAARLPHGPGDGPPEVRFVFAEG